MLEPILFSSLKIIAYNLYKNYVLPKNLLDTKLTFFNVYLIESCQNNTVKFNS